MRVACSLRKGVSGFGAALEAITTGTDLRTTSTVPIQPSILLLPVFYKLQAALPIPLALDRHMGMVSLRVEG